MAKVEKSGFCIWNMSSKIQASPNTSLLLYKYLISTSRLLDRFFPYCGSAIIFGTFHSMMLNCKIEVVSILAWLYTILFKESKVWLAENACFCSARKWHFHLQDFELTFLVLFFFFLEIISCSVCAHVWCMCMFVHVGTRELCWVSSSITLCFLGRDGNCHWAGSSWPVTSRHPLIFTSPALGLKLCISTPGPLHKGWKPKGMFSGLRGKHFANWVIFPDSQLHLTLSYLAHLSYD